MHPIRHPAILSALLLLPALGACHHAVRPKPAEADPASVRTLAQATVVGRAMGEGAQAWLGIPYARPPVDELRWRAPQPLPPGEGTFEALRYGHVCPQPSGPLVPEDRRRKDGPAGDEDCLTLNVFAPRFAPAEVPTGDRRLPVMVFFHGGGNTIGTSAYYDTAWTLAETGSVVVVTVNYRLGPFGWFRLPGLHGDDASAEDRSGNYGTLDLLAALRWVRDNATAFGGDPGNVTVFGESAGGIDIFSLLVSPRAGGLFHKAIVESGIPFSASRAEATNYVDDPEPGRANSAKEIALKLLVAEGRAPDRAGAKAILEAMSPEALRAWLHGLSPATLLSAYGTGPLGMYSAPTVIRDGAVLPETPFLSLLGRPGRYHPVPIVLGTNRDEFKLFMAFDPRFTSTCLGIPHVRDADTYRLAAGLMSRTWRALGADLPAGRLSAAGGPPVFSYRFDWDDGPKNLFVDMPTILGAAHGLELPFVFQNYDRNPFRMFTKENLPERRTIGEAMASYWTEFAHTGRPGSGRRGALPAWGQVSEGFLVFDDAQGGGLRMAQGLTSPVAEASRVLDDDAQPLEARCRLVAGQFSFVVGTGSWQPADFPSFAQGRCDAWTYPQLLGGPVP